MKRTRRGWNSTVKPGKPPKRSTTPIRKRGKGSRFPKARDPEFTKWVRGLPCCVAAIPCAQVDPEDPMRAWRRDRCFGEIQPAHVNRKKRAQGARDLGEVVPLCATHHGEQEGRSTRFNTKYGVDLTAAAQALATRWLEEHPETGEAA